VYFRCGSCWSTVNTIRDLNLADIPNKLLLAEVDTLEAQNQEGSQHLVAFARAWFKQFEWIEAREGFTLSGPTGTGKSWILAAMVRGMVEQRQIKARYVDIRAMYRRLRSADNIAQKIEEICAVPFLALDELDVPESDWETTTICEILESRWATDQPTLVAGELELADLVDVLGHRGPRIRGRLTQVSPEFRCSGPDQRVEATKSIGGTPSLRSPKNPNQSEL